MKSEEIIMVVFLGVLFTLVPIVIWLINKDTKRLEREERERNK
jgi:hypothetical protein